jgi:hypothetical protein
MMNLLFDLPVNSFFNIGGNTGANPSANGIVIFPFLQHAENSMSPFSRWSMVLSSRQ